MAIISVENAIARIRASSHDISDEYSDMQCLEFLNTAIQQVSSLLVSASWAMLIRESKVRNGDTLPDNFMRAAGTYPIRMSNGRVEIVDEDYDTVTFRYFTTPSYVTLEDDLPFEHDGVNAVIIRSATILALNENEYDVSQDTAIVTSLQEAIASGLSQSG